MSADLPRGWSITIGGRGAAVRLHAIYTASCGGLLHVTLDRGEIAYDADDLRAVDEAVLAARALLERLRLGTLPAEIPCTGRLRRRRARH